LCTEGARAGRQLGDRLTVLVENHELAVTGPGDQRIELQDFRGNTMTSLPLVRRPGHTVQLREDLEMTPQPLG
jgi:hypothetical protein